jgi:hypothetical protein
MIQIDEFVDPEWVLRHVVFLSRREVRGEKDRPT